MRVFPIATYLANPERAALVAGTTQFQDLHLMVQNPDSYLRVVKPQFLVEGLRAGTEEFYGFSLKHFGELLGRDALVKEDAACWYYRQELPDGSSFEGWILGIAASDYLEGKIRRHENTIRDKEARLARHIGILHSVAEPVLLAASLPDGLSVLASELVKCPVAMQFSDAFGRQHKLWKTSEPSELDEIQRLFRKIPDIYIADGHHRSAATCLHIREAGLNPETSGIMGLVMDKSSLLVKSFHRIIQVEAPVWKLEETCRIKGWTLRKLMQVPEKLNAGSIIGMSLEGVFELVPGKPLPDAGIAGQLDVARLENDIFPALFGIENSRIDSRISFLRGDTPFSELKEMLKSGKAGWVFAVAANQMDDIIHVADAGEVMPPKSTWVEPKLLTGMLVMRFVSA